MAHILYLIGISDDRLLEVCNIDPDGIRYRACGNCVTLLELPLRNHHISQLVIGPSSQPIKMQRPDLIINAICDPDLNSKSLADAEQFVSQLDIAVVNRPAMVLETKRHLMYQRLHSIPGVIYPRTVVCTPESPEDILQHIVSEDIGYPAIVRKAGAHGGKDLVLLESKDQLAKLHRFAFDGGNFYITRFYDLSDSQGLYSKCRFAVIAGIPYPRHLLFDGHWCIHGDARKQFMRSNPQCAAREQEFLTGFLNGRHDFQISILRTIYELVKLDFFGVDCCLDPKGNLLIYEINTSMNMNLNDTISLQHFPYLTQSIENMSCALLEMIEKKISTGLGSSECGNKQ